MPIVSKTSIRKGRLITLRYVFEDSTIRELNVRGDSDVIAADLLLHHEPNVLASKQNADISAAIASDSDNSTADATQVQVYKGWMFKGFTSDDPIEAYQYLSKVAEKVIALGLTVAQLAAVFEEDITVVEDVLVKWQYLKANEDTISAYKTVKENM